MADQERLYPIINKPRYKLMQALLWPFFFGPAARITVKGQQNVPPQGRAILAVNHLDAMDIPILFLTIPRYLYVFAAEKYKKHWWGAIMQVAGAIFIRQDEADREALRAGDAVLSNDHLLVVAIEGTRAKSGGLQAGKGGVAFLANRTNSTVIPVALTGTEKVFKGLRRLARPAVSVEFGQPIHLPAERLRAPELEAYTEQIMVAIARMLPPDYRGVYAEHPQVLDQQPADQSSVLGG